MDSDLEINRSSIVAYPEPDGVKARRGCHLASHARGGKISMPTVISCQELKTREREGENEFTRVLGNNVQNGGSWARSGDRSCIIQCAWD